MAPRTRNSEKKRAKSRKKEVRFPRRELPIRKSATVIRPPENYENLILYYLTKLKRLFSSPDHPQPPANENSADRMRREQLTERSTKSKSKLNIDPDKYTARRSTPKPREGAKDFEQDVKDKVYNVVNAAIQYGFANNVLERKGDCFVFKNKRSSKIANRQLTPGPASSTKRSYCSQCNCSNCQNINNSSSNHNTRRNSSQGLQNCRPFSEHSTHRQKCSDRRPITSVNPSRFHEAKPQSLSRSLNKINLNGKGRTSRSKSCVVTRTNLKDRLRKVCSCRKCRLLEKRRKSQKK